MNRNTCYAFVLAAWMLPTVAAAQSLVDQEQTTIELLSHGIGGSRDHWLAQSVTVGIDGFLTHIEVPVRCSGGSLQVEIVWLEGDLPSGSRILALGHVDAADLPPAGEFPPPFVRIALNPTVRMSRGDRFVFILRNSLGSCDMPIVGSHDPYPEGTGFHAYVEDDGRRSPWVGAGLFGGPADLAFRTIVFPVATSQGGDCRVRGLQDPLPIQRDAPLCRCMRDEALREQRCTLLHPSFVLVRRVPFPLKAREEFTVQWTLLPLAPLDGIVAVDDSLAPGFTTSLKAPLWFFTDPSRVGEATTLSYTAIAPNSGGTFQLKTDLTVSGATPAVFSGSLHTTMPVIRVR